jgi:hypothetical protein
MLHNIKTLRSQFDWYNNNHYHFTYYSNSIVVNILVLQKHSVLAFVPFIVFYDRNIRHFKRCELINNTLPLSFVGTKPTYVQQPDIIFLQKRYDN